MAFDLLQTVDWNEWRRVASRNEPSTPIDPVYLPKSEAERVALLVLQLGRQRPKSNKAIAKSIRTALRDIEQAVLMCEQEIDYEIA